MSELEDLFEAFGPFIHPTVQRLHDAQRLLFLDLKQQFPEVPLAAFVGAIEDAGWTIAPKRFLDGPLTEDMLTDVIPTAPEAMTWDS